MNPCLFTRLLTKAQSGGYAVGGFSTRGTYLIEAVLQAAQACNSPVILQVSQTDCDLFQVDSNRFAKRFLELRQQFTIPAALHLDHTKNLSVIRRAIAAGFGSVMIDASHLPFAENLEMTRQAVEYAHDHGAAVEAELGRISATDHVEGGGPECYTDPEEAADFVARTGVDALAVSIGTVHGSYGVKEPRLDLVRLAQIRALVDVPLVLHGGSGLSPELVRKAIHIPGGGMTKLNIATDLEECFLHSLGCKGHLTDAEVWRLPEDALRLAAQDVRKLTQDRMAHLLGSANHAADAQILPRASSDF